MFKLTESENTIRTLSNVSVEGYESIPANATVPKGHRLWRTYEAWLEAGNTPEPFETEEEKFNRLEQEIRSKRNQLLAESDWTQLPDSPVSQDWKNYRQALRDITDQDSFPIEVVWPPIPNGG